MTNKLINITLSEDEVAQLADMIGFVLYDEKYCDWEEMDCDTNETKIYNKTEDLKRLKNILNSHLPAERRS